MTWHGCDIDIPSQVPLDSVKPSLQRHWYDPGVFKHVALVPQGEPV